MIATAHTVETSATAALAAVRDGSVSALELTSYFLARIFRGNTDIRALRHVMGEEAIEAARTVDARLQAGEELPLAGLPIVVKENCDTVGAPCSAGLSFRTNHWPSTDSWITAKLRASGAIILGVAVSDPGAFDVRTPEVTHPADPSLTVGGSSGGSAAALAAGFCLGAIGTDTGGSIRIPSACCGTAGLKPTFSALPMDGIFPLVPSLDHVGPMARTVEDLSLLWSALSCPETPISAVPRNIGYDPAWLEVADDRIRTAFAVGLDRLKEHGVVSSKIVLPALEDVVDTHRTIFLVESLAYHEANHGNRLRAYPPAVRHLFQAARGIDLATYRNAVARRAEMTRQVDVVLNEVDALVLPTICVVRPQLDAEHVTIADVEHDFTLGLVRLTSLFDHTGHPAVACPVTGAPDPLAASVQVVGRHKDEGGALLIASMLA